MFELSDIPQPVLRYATGLWRRRWVVVIVAWLVALAGWFMIWLMPDVYQARAQVYVQTETILDPVMNGVTARVNYDRRVEVMTLQLLTKPNMREAVLRAGLDEKFVTGETPAQRAQQLEGLVNYVSSRINIRSPQRNYFDITFSFGDPEGARDLVDAVLNLLIEQDLGAGLSESVEAKKRLEEQIASFDAELIKSERAVANFRSRNASELAVAESNARRREQVEQDLSRLADDLSLARRRVTTSEALLAQIPRETSGNELDTLLVELAALRSQYEDAHPDIQAIQARIDELSAGSRNRLPSNPEYQRISAELRSARDSVASIEDRIADLNAEREALAVTLGRSPEVQVELQRIERDYEQARKSYNELVDRRDRLNLTESLGAGAQGVAYQIFERPVAAIKPASPPRMLFILMTLVAAVGVGCGLAALLTFLERSFSQTKELETTFGLPVLGAMSEVHSDAVRSLWRRDMARMAVALFALAVVGAGYTYATVFRLPEHAGGTGPETAQTDREARLSAPGIRESDQ